MAVTMLRELFHLREMDDFPGPFARRARQVTAELRATWGRTSREAATNRRLPDLHAARDDYHALLKGHLQLLADYLALAELHRRAFDSNPVWVVDLRRAVDDLKALHDELFPRCVMNQTGRLLSCIFHAPLNWSQHAGQNGQLRFLAHSLE